MIFKQNNFEIQTNLGGKSYNQLLNGKWKLGFISDNQGLDDENNDNYYHTVQVKDQGQGQGQDEKNHRSFNNKVQVKLIDGSIVNQHIIHWVKSDGYFCVTTNSFWDQFD
jgi:hypothetical protein